MKQQKNIGGPYHHQHEAEEEDRGPYIHQHEAEEKDRGPIPPPQYRAKTLVLLKVRRREHKVKKGGKKGTNKKM